MFVRTVLFLAGAGTLFAQSPSPVVGVGTFIHVVADLDKTMQFYGDRLGLQMTGAPGPRTFSTNAVVENLYDAKGSQSRVAVFKIPGSPLGVEFVEFKDAKQKPFRPGAQDVGASLLTISVGDFPSGMGEGMVEDPDGFFVELTKGAPGAKLSLTVANMDRSLRLFQGLLGFQPAIAKHAILATASMNVPGAKFEVDLVEYKHGKRQGAAPGIHDPGAGVLRLAVRDVDGLLQTLKAAGVPVASAGGEPVSIGNRHFVIMREPDNFFVQLVPQPNPAPK